MSPTSAEPPFEATSTRRKWLFRVAAATLSTSAAVIAAWLFLRSREGGPIYLQEPGYERTGHRYVYDEHLGWRNIPGWEATTNGRQLTINSKGLRDREYAYEKAAGVHRVLVLGDSFVWGYGVADDEVFTEVLEQSIARESPAEKVEVINAGVSGWGTDQELLFLEREGFKYSPDVVVLALFAGNDPANNATSQQYGLEKPVFLNTRLEVGNVPVPKPGGKRSAVESKADPIELTVAIIERMHQRCRQRGCRVVVMKFGRFLPLFRNDARVRRLEELLKAKLPDLADLVHLDLDDAFKQRRIGLQDVLRGNDDGHWNAFGHATAATILHECLKSNRLIPAVAKSQ